MWNGSYFAPRYFAPHYWPKVGHSAFPYLVERSAPSRYRLRYREGNILRGVGMVALVIMVRCV
jgi:hypothetical protein